MARGNLPAQTPIVPRESFLAIDFIYRYLLGTDVDLKTLEGKVLLSNLSVASSTTLVQAPELSFQLLGTKRVRFEAELYVSANVKLRHYGPAAPSKIQISRTQIEAATLVAALDTAYSAADIVATPAAVIKLSGIIHNGVNAGQVGVSWAQAVSNATPSVIYAGSYIRYSPID